MRLIRCVVDSIIRTVIILTNRRIPFPKKEVLQKSEGYYSNQDRVYKKSRNNPIQPILV